MKKAIGFSLLLWFSFSHAFGQNIGISNDGSTPEASAILAVKSTEKGVLVPRMNSNQRTAISNPADGLMVYDTELQSFYFFANNHWNPLPSGDHLGNHQASQNLQTNQQWLSGDGDNEGVFINAEGETGIGTETPDAPLEILGAGDQDVLLKLNLERAWQFEQEGTTSANLLLRPLFDRKLFGIENSDGSKMVSQFFADNTSPEVVMVPQGGSVGVGVNSTPSHTLQINGDGYFSQSLAVQQNLITNSAAEAGFGRFNNQLLVAEKAYLQGMLLAKDAHFSADVNVVGKTFLNNGLTIGNYSFPLLNGTTGSFLATNGNGQLSWQNGFLTQISFGFTSVSVEPYSGANFIAFQLESTQRMAMQKNSQHAVLAFTNSSNLLLGNNTATSLSSGDVRNVFIGKSIAPTTSNSVEKNLFIGNEAANQFTGGSENVMLGFRSGYRLNQAGNSSDNVFLGKEVAFNNNRSSFNVLIGNKANFNSNYSTTALNNVVAGHEAGYNLKGQGNVILGSKAGNSLENHDYNIIVHPEKGGFTNNTGDENIYIGTEAGVELYGSKNIIIGNRFIDNSSVYGNNLIAIGKNALEGLDGFNVTISNTIALGWSAGRLQLEEAVNNRLIISGLTNQLRSEGANEFPLIHGNFTYDELVINGDLYADSFINLASRGSRPLQNSEPLGELSDRISKLRPYQFKRKQWDNFSGWQYGLDPESLQSAFPELVTVIDAESKVYGIDYEQLMVILWEALRQQQQKISTQKESLQRLKSVTLEANALKSQIQKHLAQKQSSQSPGK